MPFNLRVPRVTAEFEMSIADVVVSPNYALVECLATGHLRKVCHNETLGI